MPIQIIAEAGVNHNGDFGLALKMADAAKAAGADVVKYQPFQPEELASRYAGKASYQKETTDAEENQLNMLKKLTLRPEEYRKLKIHCDEIGIGFASTPFERTSVAILEKLDMPFWKIPSGEAVSSGHRQDEKAGDPVHRHVRNGGNPGRYGCPAVQRHAEDHIAALQHGVPHAL